MNLTFDLQLFDDVTVKGGVSLSDKEYTLENVSLSAALGGDASGPYASFNAGAVSGGLGTGTTRNSYTPGDYLVTFGVSVSGSASVPSGVVLGGGNSYTWRIYSDTIDKIELGKDVNLVLAKTAENKSNLGVYAYGGQSVKFDNSKTIQLKMTDTATIGGVAFLGDRGNVSLLSGSSVKGATVSGSSDGVISLASSGSNANIFNLKGSDSEAFVSLGGASGGTVESAELSGFKSIVFDAKGTASTAGSGVILTGGVKNSAVSIFGGEGADTVSIGGNVNASSQVLISGGEGTDTITLSKTGRETVVLGTGHGLDSVQNWLESKGDTAKGNTISLKGAIDTFNVRTVTGGYADVSIEATGAITNGATISSGTSNNQLGVNLITSDDTYSALLVGKDSLSSTVGTKFDNFGYIIADESETLNLGDTNKKTVVLANEVDQKHWGDVNVYQNVTTVIASGAGNSFLVNGVADKSARLEAAGKNDSIWGGANGVGDTIAFNNTTKATNVKIFTGAKDGVDSVVSYTYATDTKLANANAIRFLDGVEYIVAGENNLTIGANADNNVEVRATASAAGNKVAYGFGTGDDKYIAMVDMTKGGNANLTYGSDVSVYIGQGDKTNIKVDSSAKEVKLGWDGGAGYVSIGGVDAAMAADGAVIVGTTDNAQSIAGSSRGASSISGGFVADKWTDDNADTLVGGGVATKSTTFFVGEQMGRDEIQNLSSKDNIVFLGSKFADLVGFKDPDTADNSITFKFANNTIEANLASGKTMKNLTDVSLYFDDGTYIWNGSEFAKAE